MALALIDGHYYAYRFHHGQPDLRDSAGRPIAVLVAYAEFLRRLRRDARVTHWLLVLDSGIPGFRHHLYPAYKAQRPPMPDELRVQIPRLEALAVAAGIPVLRKDGWEADDLIAAAVRLAEPAGIESWICSRDKDLDQLLGPQVRTWDPYRDRQRGPAELARERGLHPEQVLDWLCLVGDRADNVQGVPGIGPILARRLLATHGDLDGVLEAAASMRGRRGEALRAFAPRRDLVRQLLALAPPPLAASPELWAKPRLDPADAAIRYRELGLAPARFLSPTPSAPAGIAALDGPAAAARIQALPSGTSIALHPVKDDSWMVAAEGAVWLMPAQPESLAGPRLLVHGAAALAGRGLPPPARDTALALRLLDRRADGGLEDACARCGVAPAPPAAAILAMDAVLTRHLTAHGLLPEERECLDWQEQLLTISAGLQLDQQVLARREEDLAAMAAGLASAASAQDGRDRVLSRRPASPAAGLHRRARAERLGIPLAALAQDQGDAAERRLLALAEDASHALACLAQATLLERILHQRPQSWQAAAAAGNGHWMPQLRLTDKGTPLRSTCMPRVLDLCDSRHPALPLLECLIAPPGRELLLVDARRLPLALLAQAADDTVLAACIAEGPAALAARMCCPAYLAHAAAEGLLDGRSTFAISQEAGCTREAAEMAIDAFRRGFIRTTRCLFEVTLHSSTPAPQRFAPPVAPVEPAPPPALSDTAPDPQPLSFRPECLSPLTGPPRARTDPHRSLCTAFRGTAYALVHRLLLRFLQPPIHVRLTLCDGLMAVCSLPAGGGSNAITHLERLRRSCGIPDAALACASGLHLGALAVSHVRLGA